MLKRLGLQTSTCTLLDKIMANSSGYMTRSKSFTPQIQHDLKNGQFFIEFDTTRAYLSYKKIDNILVMEHTEVPVKFAGKGLGKLLAKVCFNWWNGFYSFVYFFLCTISSCIIS